MRNNAFSIELKSKEFLRNVTVKNGMGENVLIEGYLGELKEISLLDESMLEIRGTNGIIRLDITAQDFSQLIKATTRHQTTP